MRFYSTRDRHTAYTFTQAVQLGLAPDGGLFLPETIPGLPDGFVQALPNLSFVEIATVMATPFLKTEFTEAEIVEMVEAAFPFSAPVVPLNNQYSVLELFHGPTLAFKDFGARFMAQVLQRVVERLSRPLTILVATSGDTGSAVAHGFWKKQGIRVVLLYPDGMVSGIQEQQLTTLGENIIALKVQGTFDDCQRLVKTAFLDETLRQQLRLTSANSINIARLLPQSFYYAAAIGQLGGLEQPVIFSVPSGNLGNLTGGILAAKMGLPVHRFLAALNRNDVFREFLQEGYFKPRKVIPTISNAMDVGNPSNLERIRALFNDDITAIRQTIEAYHFDDDATRHAIAHAYETHHYVFDPHGAVGYLAARTYAQTRKDVHVVVLATAHPAKFNSVIQQVLGKEAPTPERLARWLTRQGQPYPISAHFEVFKAFLLELPSV